MRPACSSCSCNGLGGPADYVPGSSRKGSSLGSYRAFSVPLRVYGSCQGSSSLGFQKVLKRFFFSKSGFYLFLCGFFFRVPRVFMAFLSLKMRQERIGSNGVL